MRVPQRRIDDRLRRACSKALTASERDRECILRELLTLIHIKSERLKRRAARLLLNGDGLEPERRSVDSDHALRGWDKMPPQLLTTSRKTLTSLFVTEHPSDGGYERREEVVT